MITTLDSEFPTFRQAFAEVLFDWTKEESKQLVRQSLPSTISMEEILAYSSEDYYRLIRNTTK